VSMPMTVPVVGDPVLPDHNAHGSFDNVSDGGHQVRGQEEPAADAAAVARGGLDAHDAVGDLAVERREGLGSAAVVGSALVVVGVVVRSWLRRQPARCSGAVGHVRCCASRGWRRRRRWPGSERYRPPGALCARAHGVRLRNAGRLPLIRSVSADRREHCPLRLGCRRKRGATLGAETRLCLRSCTAFRTELHASFLPVRQGTCAGRR
jgi:hypothetical protein